MRKVYLDKNTLAMKNQKLVVEDKFETKKMISGNIMITDED